MAKPAGTRAIRPLTLAVAIAALAGMSTGCTSTFYSTTGDVMTSYTADHLIPHILSTGDIGMTCETGVSMGGFLVSFGRVTDAPHLSAVPTLVGAGVCSQIDAFEADLRSRRAVRAGDSAEAIDARIEEKRHNTVTAKRFLAAWDSTIAEFGQPGGSCPEFESRYAELVYTLGLIASVQALQHDMAADGQAGVPLDAPAQAARATQCLNNDRWWGVPQALRAVIWISVPGIGPEGVDPWAELEQAAALGSKAGVRLPHAVYGQAAFGAGKDDVLRTVIKATADSLAATPAADEWKTLDAIAVMQVQALSDRIWTDAEGHRTPFRAMGTFPGADEEDEGDDLLDGLEDDEPAPDPTPPGGAAPTGQEN